jgi:F420-0:gamma-glutamyl ligase
MKVLTVFPMPPQRWAGTLSENGVLVMGSGSHDTPAEVIRAFQAMGLQADHIEIEGGKQAVSLDEN